MHELAWVKYTCVVSAFCAVYLLVLSARRLRMPVFQTSKIKARFEFEQDSSVITKIWKLRTWHPMMALAGGVGVWAGFILGGANWKDPLPYFIAAMGGVFGLLLPSMVRIFRRKQHLRALDLQLPDALELVSNSLRAGLSVLQALEVVVKEAAQPIAGEFEVVIRDCRLGLSPEEAMEKMLKRWDHPDLELFVVAASVSIKTGGNLAEVAGRIIETIRERFRLRGRIDSLTAQGKLSGWVVGLLPVVLVFGLLLLDPALMTGFFHHPLGIAMLGCGFVMELIGAFFIRKITAIEA